MFSIGSQLSSQSRTVASVALLKRPRPVDYARPLTEQIQIVNLPGLDESAAGDAGEDTRSPFELIHSVIHSALTPFFEAHTSSNADAASPQTGSEQRGGILAAKRKLAELELSLLQLQQNADIPQCHLPIHPLIQDVVDRAEASGRTATIEEMPASVLDDSTIQNRLQSFVNNWIKSVQAVVTASRDISKGSAAQEIKFWIDLESVLLDVEERLKNPAITLTLEVLNRAKRFSATLSLIADTRLRDTLQTIQGYNQLMKDFPLGDLLSATSLLKVRTAIENILLHINRKFRASLYPVERALPLMEAISSDLTQQVLRLLNGRTLMQLSYEDFGAVLSQVGTIWQVWEDQSREFTDVARELVRKRTSRFVPIRFSERHQELKARLQYISNFRAKHDQLESTISTISSEESEDDHNVVQSSKAILVSNVNGESPNDLVEAMGNAYSAVSNLNVLDISQQGTIQWDKAEAVYNDRAAKVELVIIAAMRNSLATAGTSSEMFGIFSKYTSLLIRPRIRGAVAEYQTQLIERVKNDIELLRHRFEARYGHTNAHVMAQLHDLPPISGSIIWARQIEKQLEGHMKRIENVLGDQWQLHADGVKLRAEADSFQKRLDTRPIFQSWLAEVSRRDLAVTGRLFDVRTRRSLTDDLELVVSFEPHVISLFKEVRNLTSMGFAIPYRVGSASKDAQKVYAFAVGLFENVRMLAQAFESLNHSSPTFVLLSKDVASVQGMIATGVKLHWQSFANLEELSTLQSGGGNEPAAMKGEVLDLRKASKHVQYVREFSTLVAKLHERATLVQSIDDTVTNTISNLKTCDYTLEAFKQELDKLQALVTQCKKHGFVNIFRWVEALNEDVEKTLSQRLHIALESWLDAFKGNREDAYQPEASDKGTGERLRRQGHYKPVLASIVHEVVMHNNVIFVDPPAEYSQASWCSSLQECIRQICDLPFLHVDKHHIRKRTFQTSKTYGFLLDSCIELLIAAQTAINDEVSSLTGYLTSWLRFQSLWDLQDETAHKRLGEDLPTWLRLLQEIRLNRATIDSSETVRAFGRVSVDYKQVQAKVTAKYDSWQSSLTSTFASKLNGKMTEVFTGITLARKSLESSSLATSSTEEAVQFITTIDAVKRQADSWMPQVETFRKGQGVLSRNRYAFPSSWLSIHQIEHEWAALTELLTRKQALITEHSEALRSRVMAESKSTSSRMDEWMSDWNNDKPTGGAVPAQDALQTLAAFEGRLSKLEEDAKALSRAKAALEITDAPLPDLEVFSEEVRDLRSVWSALAAIWRSLDEMRASAWSTVQIRKTRQALDGLIATSRELPSRLRQYAAFEHLQSNLKALLKACPILTDLKSEAMKERHWTHLMKMLRPSERYASSLSTLGDIWDLQLVMNEGRIKEIVSQAQGEMALEEYIAQVKETWSSYTLDLVVYQNKCRLIRGWDELLSLCSDHMGSLQAMRLSPFYKEFEEQASAWEERLKRVHVLFDTWIDAQRQWTYLEGIFNGNAEIKHMLPVESQRFQTINNEFFAIMKKVQRSPIVMDVLNIQGVQQSLERLVDLLQKIQKALGEYLERERAAFPRFYFVGDEDLLEIIGNSNEPSKIARHLSKMFGGVAGLLVNDDDYIVAVTSSQGEIVTLSDPVSLRTNPKVNDWLSKLDIAVKATLARLLVHARDTITEALTAAPADMDKLDRFAESYPAQIVVLAIQVWWTEAVTRVLQDDNGDFSALLQLHVDILTHLTDRLVQELEPP
ncbi:hypothetical protein MRB53_038234 [Persea americana]|nr:hypothetical protein MRB53_038234 [Persea americana]